MTELLMLSRLAIRNLFANFLNLMIGGIILVGTLLFVVGGSILNSVDTAMSRSIIGSVAGHLQVYSDKSKDELALFGNWVSPDLAAIPDFSKVKQSLLGVDNVQSVVPMGVNGASVMYGNTLDQTLEKLRKAIGRKDGGASAEIESLKSHVRQIVGVIQGDYKKLTVMSSAQAVDEEGSSALDRAASPEFWSTFDKDPLNHLEFLENRIASLVPDADFIYLSYLGTDLDAFQQSFDRMQVVDGQKVPTGQRGLLLSKYVYEEQFKLKTAHRLDKLHEALVDQGKLIAKDPDLQLMVKQNKTQTREIVLQLDPIRSAKMGELLRDFLKIEEKDVSKLLTAFFETDDANLNARYEFFYAKLAPLLELYRLKPGDTMAIKAFTKSGYVQSVNLKIYGTFQFKGLEKSSLAGGMSLMDLMSFRDLYGYVTPEKIAETQKLKDSVGSKFVDRSKAEAELFGGASVVSEARDQRIDEKRELDGVKPAQGEGIMTRVYTPDEIEKGVAINAAVILKDPSRIDQTRKAIEETAKHDGLNLRVVNWQKAAGNLGQFVFVAKAVLYFAVFIIFIVALVIINNAVMMATLQRVREIGTMRAIGAQRGFVLSLVVMETVFLGLVFGAIGTCLGALLVKWMGNVGIPAGNEFLYFFFSGPRLYVQLGLGSLIGAFVIICVVTSVSALYPAVLATRVSPLQAMQTEE
jgi:ABC-type lipoprotein release transport system permease subunit